MAKRVKWECPNGKHPAMLGSTRPPMDASVRYCLPCSMMGDRLVQRVAPALERKRKQAAARTVAKRQTAVQRGREEARRRRYVEVIEPDGSTGELDVLGTLRKMQRLAPVREVMAYGWMEHEIVEFTLRRRRDRAVTGRAWPGIEIVVSVGIEQPRERVEELILHELVHYVLPVKTNHGREFRTALMRAAKAWWPDVTPKWDGHVYRMDAAIWRQARRLAGGTEVVVEEIDSDEEGLSA